MQSQALTKQATKSVPWSLLIPTFVLGTAGIVIVLYSTVWGAGLISDSFQYIASARSLASGRGIGYPQGDGTLVAMTQYPPLYSLFLTPLLLVGVDALQAARLLNALLFGVNSILVFFSIKQIAGLNRRGPALAFAGGMVFALSPVLIEVHSWALSEPLYLTFSLLGFLLLRRYAEDSLRLVLFGSALSIAGAMLTRYIGISLVLAAVTAILLFLQLPWRRKFADLSIFTLVSLAPIALWTLRNRILTGGFNNRALDWHPPTTKNMVSAIHTVLAWFLPENLIYRNEKNFLIATLLGISLVMLFFLLIQKRNGSIFQVAQGNGSRLLFGLHAIYVLAYSIVLVSSKTLFDDNIGFTDRLLSPVLVSLLIMLFSLLSTLWNVQFRLLHLAVGLLAAYLVVFFAFGAINSVPKFHKNGLGIARRSWHEAESIHLIRSNTSLPMYSNSPSTLYLWTGDTGFGLADFEATRTNSSQPESMLIVFHHVPANARIRRLSEGLKLVANDKVATVYLIDP